MFVSNAAEQHLKELSLTDNVQSRLELWHPGGHWTQDQKINSSIPTGHV